MAPAGVTYAWGYLDPVITTATKSQVLFGDSEWDCKISR